MTTATLEDASERSLSRLRERGLIISDPQKAAFYLDRIGWFRFGAYFVPLEKTIQRDPHISVTFDDVLRLYRFDRRLRLLFLDATERVEMAIKSCLFNFLTSGYGKWWFHRTDVYFLDENLRQSIVENIERNPKRKYHPQADSEFNPLGIFELMTFGQVSKMVSCLPNDAKTDICAKFVRYDRDKKLDSADFVAWLKAITYVRNTAAHHSRLWNQNFESFLPIPGFIKSQLSGPRAPEKWKQKLYGRAVILFYLLDRIARNTCWHVRLNSLIKENESVPLPLYRQMGFPEGWARAEFWNPPRGGGAESA